MSAVRRSYERSEWREAHRVYKQTQNGVKGALDLTVREYGLLYLHFPEVLPDVDRGGST